MASVFVSHATLIRMSQMVWFCVWYVRSAELVLVNCHYTRIKADADILSVMAALALHSIAQRCECFPRTTLLGQSKSNDSESNNQALWTLLLLIEFPIGIPHNFGLKICVVSFTLTRVHSSGRLCGEMRIRYFFLILRCWSSFRKTVHSCSPRG